MNWSILLAGSVFLCSKGRFVVIDSSDELAYLASRIYISLFKWQVCCD